MPILGKLVIACAAAGVVAVSLADNPQPQEPATVAAKGGSAECALAARFDGPARADSRLAARLQAGLGCKVR